MGSRVGFFMEQEIRWIWSCSRSFLGRTRSVEGLVKPVTLLVSVVLDFAVVHLVCMIYLAYLC